MLEQLKKNLVSGVLVLVAFIVGVVGFDSSTPVQTEQKSGGLVETERPFFTQGFVVEGKTDLNLVNIDWTNDRVGISTTSPVGLLSVGDGGATSTVATGRFCLLTEDEAGRNMWVTLSTSGNTVFSTSTSACND